MECEEEKEAISTQKSLVHYSLLKINFSSEGEGVINSSTKRNSLSLCAGTISDLHVGAELSASEFMKNLSEQWDQVKLQSEEFEALVCKTAGVPNRADK